MDYETNNSTDSIYIYIYIYIMWSRSKSIRREFKARIGI
jgi:hypothetical protein